MTSRTSLWTGLPILVAVAGFTSGPAQADQDPPFHHVRYTLTAQHPIFANMYYLDHEPASFADWSHNPYEFMPNVQVDVGPGTVWSYDLDLQRPEIWAVLVANTGPEPGTPNFHCEVAVDGTVVVSAHGAKGVLCSTRPW